MLLSTECQAADVRAATTRLRSERWGDAPSPTHPRQRRGPTRRSVRALIQPHEGTGPDVGDAHLGLRPPCAVEHDGGAAAASDPRFHEWGSYRDTLNTRTLQRALSRRYRRRTARYPLHSSLRDALFADLAGQLVAYDALCRAWEERRVRVRERLISLVDDPTRSLTPETRDELARLGRPPSWPPLRAWWSRTSARCRPLWDRGIADVRR